MVGDGKVTITAVVRGALVQEVRQRFAPWLTQVVRLVAGQLHAELEWTVGEVPIAETNTTLSSCVAWRGEPDRACADLIDAAWAGHCECFGGRKASVSGVGGHPRFTCAHMCQLHGGKDVVSRFNTSVASEDAFLTDSNGREMLLRRRDQRPGWNFSQTEPVAGNYFPVTTAAAVRDASVQLTVLTDRAQGVASLAPGMIELMVHRRTMLDDGRGAAEALDERERVDVYGRGEGAGLVVRGSHIISVGRPTSAAARWRPLADRIFAKPLLRFEHSRGLSVGVGRGREWSKGEWGGGRDGAGLGGEPSSFSALLTPLPPNVQLLTLQLLRHGLLLLRLGHQFSIDEDASLSSPVGVDLGSLFDPAFVNITAAREVSLTANQDKSAILARRRLAVKWHAEDGAQPHKWRSIIFDFAVNRTVVLGPLEIKTFELDVS